MDGRYIIKYILVHIVEVGNWRNSQAAKRDAHVIDSWTRVTCALTKSCDSSYAKGCIDGAIRKHSC
jgi:hypothetical protein